MHGKAHGRQGWVDRNSGPNFTVCRKNTKYEDPSQIQYALASLGYSLNFQEESLFIS